MAREIKIGIGYEDDIAFFTLKAITLAEDEDFAAKFADTQDLESSAKREAETEIYIQTIADWTVKPLEKKTGNGFKPYFSEKKKTVAEEVREFFDKGDFDKERVASQLLFAYRQKLQPTVVFQ